jgi:prolyl oligopeptidase
MINKSFLIFLALLGMNTALQAQQDKFLWLEDVDSEKSLEYVEAQNKTTFDKLSQQKDYQSIYNKSLDIYNSTERIAYPSIQGKYIYNFWKDKDHVRGIWRRCLVDDYLNKTIQWETLLDIDEMAEKDNIKWVYKGASGLYPDYNSFLVNLSKGGGDAVIVREYDAVKKEFIENGFTIAEAKGNVGYVDENTVIVSTDFGEGTMTTSGYPRQVKLWKRGTSIKDAQLIFEGDTTDVSSSGYVIHDGTQKYVLVRQGKTFYTSKLYVWENNKLISLDLPEDIGVKALLNNQLVVQLKSDWNVNGTNYTNGTLLSLNFTELIKGKKEVAVILVPDAFSSIDGIDKTKTKLLINLLTNVTGELFSYSFSNGKWTNKKINAPDLGTINIGASDDTSDRFFFMFENFITPSKLYVADATKNTIKEYQSLPAYFDGSKYEVKQFKAKSKDGTMVPYFMVHAKNMKYDGTNPTLVYAYGGFEISSKPSYNATNGVSWLDYGGVYVLANIRGGGEYGPKWHQGGLKEKRQNVFDDLYAVSEDLIAKKVTAPKHMGVMGGSNGGLLVGVALTQRPDLYNAVVCLVPLLDMQRYNKLLAGASWMGEFGNPDIPEEWDYIQKYSPYHNLKTETKYPEVFFYTSTRDDRVHPGHARKMNALMNEMGYKTYYYENMEGGHAGSSTNEQTAKRTAMTFSYLLMKLK